MKTARLRRRVVFASFSGIDGAGKSTQIANLEASLREAGLATRVVTFWDDVATLKGFRESVGHKVFKGDKGVGSPDAPIHRRDKNVRHPIVSLVRLGFYFLDALSLRRTLRVVRGGEADVVIFDRYLYDELANLNMDHFASRLYIRVVMRLVAQPELSFVLDADPDKAFARKPEYPLDFLRSNREAYLRLSTMLGGITVIPALPLAEAKAELIRHVWASGILEFPIP